MPRKQLLAWAGKAEAEAQAEPRKERVRQREMDREREKQRERASERMRLDEDMLFYVSTYITTCLIALFALFLLQ